MSLYMYVVQFLRYSASKNGLTLKRGVGVVQGHNIVTFQSGLEVTQDHSNWYHSKAWVQFAIRLP